MSLCKRKRGTPQAKPSEPDLIVVKGLAPPAEAAVIDELPPAAVLLTLAAQVVCDP